MYVAHPLEKERERGEGWGEGERLARGGPASGVARGGGCMRVHLHPIHTPVHPLLCRCSLVCLPKPIKVLTHYMHIYSTVIASNKHASTYTWTVYMK